MSNVHILVVEDEEALAMRPVQKGDHMWEVVQDLVRQAKQHVSIDRVYADAEFCAAGVLRVLDDENIGFIIPSPKNKRVKREIDPDGVFTSEMARRLRLVD